MRLLNTTTFALEEFFEKDVPPYAILSHRWEAEEILFRDLDPDRRQSHPPLEKQGWKKLAGCCKRAIEDGYVWVWIDTCCIDKSSSAELSEAINSMFAWYQNAGICYAYLSDVGGHDGEPGYARDPDLANLEFRQSKWFTRGWTLQELLAPKSLTFFDRTWQAIGSRKEMAKLVQLASGINHLQKFELASVAQKFSWAAKRETTRVEDRAYSLLGLFGINMPPIYGEGEKAFLRLQLEIIKITNDETIFAWTDDGARPTGLLAKSPDAFKLSCNMRSYYVGFGHPSFEMTNQGLWFETSSVLLMDTMTRREGEFDIELNLFPLQCRTEDTDANGSSRVAVCLRQIERNVYARVYSAKLERLSDSQDQSFLDMAQRKRTKQSFHVSQFGSPLTRWRSYVFTTKLSPEIRRRFIFTAEIKDNYARKPITSKWQMVKGSHEARLTTANLPISGTRSAIRYREIHAETDCSKLKQEGDTFIVRIIVWNHIVYCDVYAGKPREYYLTLESVIASREQRDMIHEGSTAALTSGFIIKATSRKVDDTGLNYEIDIEAGEEKENLKK